MSSDLHGITQHLSRLIAFDSQSHKSNRDLIDYIADCFAEKATQSDLFVSDNKASLMLRFGPDLANGIALSGHSDVVPVEGQNWATDPFTLTEKGSRLYGRGTTDMKGFIAVAMAVLEKRDLSNLTQPIYLIVTHDEETDCSGVLPVIDHMKKMENPPSAILVGEPSQMMIVNQHKGNYGYFIDIVGLPVHSSIPHAGVSAISLAADLIKWIDQAHRDFAKNAQDGPFTPNHTTCHVGMMQGGEAVNILAGTARLHWDLRTMPGEDIDGLLARFQEFANSLLDHYPDHRDHISITLTEDYALPGLGPDHNPKSTALAGQIAQTNASDAMNFFTEAAIYQAHGFDTVLLGPGALAQAHICDEFVEKEQLLTCEKALNRLIDSLSAAS